MSDMKQAVRQGYGQAARGVAEASRDGANAVAKAFGYSDAELASIPDESHMGLSCGNPTAMASLKPGEVVVDLGSGGGLDVFLAAKAVGPEGRAIGIDMTEDMVVLARKNAEKNGFENVAFHHAEIEAMPLEDNSVDCVISNCVLNLVPDKDKAFAEIFRILKPGGRLAVSDIALKKPLPEALAKDVGAWVGCIAGAISAEDNEAGLTRAGFRDIAIVDASADLNAYREMGEASCCAPDPSIQASNEASACCAPKPEPSCCGTPEATVHEDLTRLTDQYDINDYAMSAKIFALK